MEEELELAKQALSDSETRSEELKAKKRIRMLMSDLEPFNGYVKYDWKRDKNGKPIRDENGHMIYDEAKIIKRKPGMIQTLAGEAQRLRDGSNLGRRFLDRTFENFDTSKDKVAYKSAVSFAERDDLFTGKQNCVIIMGDVGTGKTHLAAAIANRLIERGIPVLFGTFSDHLEKIKEEFDNTSIKTYLSKMKSTPMLVLDDLGKERRSEWTQQILFDVINYRYEHMLPTVITTNFNDDGILNYVGNAIASRLYETSDSIRTTGNDYRRAAI